MTFAPRWSDDRIARVAAMRQAGKSVVQISAEMGETFDAVQSIIRRKSILSTSNAGRPPIDTEKSDDIRECCERHVKDILRVHGPGKTWATHNIPSEPTRNIYAYRSSADSLMGSSSQMCADLGVTT